MKRQIKFRIWDRVYGKMFCPEKNNEYKIYANGSVAQFETWCTGDVVLLQFTGLKDKNGKEVYEGDIVRRMADKYDHNLPEGEDHWKEEQLSQVIYRGNGFWVKDEDFGWEGENLWDWEQMEVIGNIYNNPELLTPSL